MGMVFCKRCFRTHFETDAETVAQSIKDFIKFYEDASEDIRSHYGSRPVNFNSLLNDRLFCKNCGETYKNFKDGCMAPDGATIQEILTRHADLQDVVDKYSGINTTGDKSEAQETAT